MSGGDGGGGGTEDRPEDTEAQPRCCQHCYQAGAAGVMVETGERLRSERCGLYFLVSVNQFYYPVLAQPTTVTEQQNQHFITFYKDFEIFPIMI